MDQQQADERIASQLKNTLNQLRVDINKAFDIHKKAENNTQTLELTEYLLKIKEHELTEITTESGGFSKKIITFARACNNLMSGHTDVKYVLDAFGRVIDSAVIFWLQAGYEYDLYSVGISEEEASRLFISLLPVLSDDKTPMPYFQKGLDHYLVYTETDKFFPDDIKAVLFTRHQKSFMTYERELAGILSELIFKIKVRHP